MIAFIKYQICYHFTIERIQLPEISDRPKESFGTQLKIIIKGLTTNRALVGIIIATIQTPDILFFIYRLSIR